MYISFSFPKSASLTSFHQPSFMSIISDEIATLLLLPLNIESLSLVVLLYSTAPLSVPVLFPDGSGYGFFSLVISTIVLLWTSSKSSLVTLYHCAPLLILFSNLDFMSRS